jgi:putative tricarboxylic transport membrane protein
LEYAGFVVSAFLFIVAVSRVLGSRSLIRDLIVAVVLPLAIYFPFTRLLDIFLPAGVFPL